MKRFVPLATLLVLGCGGVMPPDRSGLPQRKA